MRSNRKVIMPEKSISIKRRRKTRYLCSAMIFVLWMFLFYLYNSSMIVSNSTHDVSMGKNFSFTLRSSKSDEDSAEISNETAEKTQLMSNYGINDLNVQKPEENQTLDEKLEKENGAEDKNKPLIDLNQVENSNQKFISMKEMKSADRTLSSNEETGRKGKNDESVNLSRVSERRSRKIGTKRKPVVDSDNVKKTGNEMIRSKTDQCKGKYIYIHDLPTLFNDDLLKNCKSLSSWTDMCEWTTNMGLGPRLRDLERIPGWFNTNQFTSEVIFYNRMKNYKCLTKNSTLASAIFVPYFAGLDVARYLWGPYPSTRDAGALDLMKWLRTKPEWKRMWGRDHFMVAGRTTWDFMRTEGNDTDWGNRLMNLPETRNMTVLLIESSPWNYHGFAIPYPTYFHPSKDHEVIQWQNKMRKQRRPYLFSFVGAPRLNSQASIRREIMDQCRKSKKKCKLFECVSGSSNKCYKPDQVMKFFQSSTFCLQPQGDSYTRRSTFDSILAGCIPVFFHPGSAYAQYTWHLPKDFAAYSVFIPENEIKEGKARIEKILEKIPREKVVAMREEVIKIIPNVIYGNPKGRLDSIEDAFDLTVKGVLGRIEKVKVRVEEGVDPLDFHEGSSWKYNLFGSVEKHEWDHFFDRV